MIRVAHEEAVVHSKQRGLMSVKKNGREPHVKGAQDGFHGSWCQHKVRLNKHVYQGFINGRVDP